MQSTLSMDTASSQDRGESLIALAPARFGTKHSRALDECPSAFPGRVFPFHHFHPVPHNSRKAACSTC